MFKQLLGWSGRVVVNGTEYESVGSVPNDIEITTITLLPKVEKKRIKVDEVEDNTEHVITVRQFMTRVDSNPMPMRTMVGKIVRETAKAVYMELHGQALPVVTCMRCGRTLTNPVSRHYGLGIECIQKVGIPFDANDVENIKEAMVDVKWTGWCPKSAIESDEIFRG